MTNKEWLEQYPPEKRLSMVAEWLEEEYRGNNITINVDLNELMMIEIGLLSIEQTCRLNERTSLLEHRVTEADKFNKEAEEYKVLAKRLEKYIPHRESAGK